MEKILLEELTKMLPYEVWCKIGVSKYKRSGPNAIRVIEYSDIILGKEEFDEILHDPTIVECKPYLRQLSSMTNEEREEWADLFNKPLIELDKYSDKDAEEVAPQMFAMSHLSSINWLYSKHFNIILPKEEFIEVTEENNPYKS